MENLGKEKIEQIIKTREKIHSDDAAFESRCFKKENKK